MKNKNVFTYSIALAAAMLFFMPRTSTAQDFVYTPKNPAFGGSPLNYNWLLSSAGAQNLYQGDRDFGFNRNPLDDFQQTLQRRILRELTQNIIEERFGEIDLSRGGSFDFGNFSIEVVPGPNGINILIQNLATGEQTTITIPNV